MKKSIFLFFAAILCAMTANAQWYLMGTVTDWSSGKQMTGDSKVVSVTINLAAKTNYELKIKSGKTWYGNGGTMTSTNNLVWEFSSSNGSNAKITTTDAGDYTFTWYISDKKLSVTYPNHNYIIAGDGAVMEDEWSPSSTNNKMSKQDDGTYRLTKTNRSLSVKTYGYKLTVGSWSVNQYPNDNVALKVTTAGNYNVVFTYNPKNGQLSHELVPIYTITTSANPATAGTITGAGTYAKDASVTLEATPNAGYKFVNWTVGGVEKSTDAKYSFTASADVTAVANFELSDPEVPTYTISVSANNDAMGTVTGAGDYTEGSPVTLTATPNAGYKFVNWTVGSEVKSTDATYSFTASEALTIVANFEAIPKYDITVKAVVPETWTNATIGIHYWGDGISGTSTPVATEKEGNWNKYTIKDVLEGQSVNVIFLNGTSWTDDKSKQTANITGITEDKCFQISAKTLDGEGKCTFTEVDCAADIKPEGDVYTMMGVGELGLSWDLATTGNDMTKQTDGTYTLVKEGLDLATTGNYEYKVIKNHSWDWSIPSGNTNQTLKVDKDGTYTVTFTLSADKTKLTADAECTAEKEVILDCFVAGTTNLVGGTTDFTDELPMTYDEGTKTYSKTFTALAAGNYQMKVVYGSDWLGYDKLTKPVPANVTEGDDKKIKFSLAEAGDVTVTYHVENGIGLVGTFAAPAPEAKKYYVKGTHNEWTADATSEMTLDGEVYKKEVTLAKDVEFKINDGADGWWGKDNLGGKSYNELEGLESGNLKMKEAKTFTIIFKPAEHLITFEGLTEKAPVPTTYTVAGDSEAAFGTTWDPTNTANDMALEGGLYKWTKTNVALYANTKISFKVVKNHDWNKGQWPERDGENDNNWILQDGITADGLYTITITFNESTKEIQATATKTGDIVIKDFSNQPATLYFHPSFHWTSDAAQFAAYFYNNGPGADAAPTWASMTDGDGDGIYEVTNAKKHEYVIICRMNPSRTENRWNQEGDEDAKKPVWNQIQDGITIPNAAGDLNTCLAFWTNCQGNVPTSECTWVVPTPLTDANWSTFVSTYAGQTINAVVERSFTSGQNHTLCLPFNLPTSWLGDRSKAYQLNSIFANTAEELQLNASECNTIEAGKPYIIVPIKGSEYEHIIVSGVIVEDVDAGTNVATGDGYKATLKAVTTTGGQTNGSTEYYVGANDGCLYNAVVNKLGLRAIIELTTIEGQALPANVRARVVNSENAATGLDNITNGENTTIKVIENGQLIIIRNGEKFNAQGVRL